MEQSGVPVQSLSKEPWNKGKLVGQKAPLRVKEIWAIRIRLQLAERTRELALFNLAVDSKLRSCDLMTVRVRDITHRPRAQSLIYRRTKNLRAVQLLLGHSKLRAPFDISVSKSTTHSKWPNRRKCSSREGRSAADCWSLTGQQRAHGQR